MSRMTASEAANIAQAKDPAFAVDTILAGVKKAADEGKYEYITREYGFGDGSCYCNEDKYPPLCKAILKELRALGYACTVRTHEGQFVDMWLSVKWGKRDG